MTCGHCGRPFVASRSDARYCGDACRQGARRGTTPPQWPRETPAEEPAVTTSFPYAREGDFIDQILVDLRDRGLIVPLGTRGWTPPEPRRNDEVWDDSELVSMYEFLDSYKDHWLWIIQSRYTEDERQHGELPRESRFLHNAYEALEAIEVLLEDNGIPVPNPEAEERAEAQRAELKDWLDQHGGL